MVEAAVAIETRASIAPGVQAGSGRPPWLAQPLVFVLGDGVHAAVRMVGTGRAAASVGGLVGGRVGAAVAAAVGAATSAVGTAVGGADGGGAAAGAQAVRATT